MSEWKEQASRRRDERNTKVEVRPPANSKKNTKRWCRGVVGRDHKPECRDRPSYFSVWKELTCTECGKVLETYFPALRKWGYESRKPDWVK